MRHAATSASQPIHCLKSKSSLTATAGWWVGRASGLPSPLHPSTCSRPATMTGTTPSQAGAVHAHAGQAVELSLSAHDRLTGTSHTTPGGTRQASCAGGKRSKHYFRAPDDTACHKRHRQVCAHDGRQPTIYTHFIPDRPNHPVPFPISADRTANTHQERLGECRPLGS